VAGAGLAFAQLWLAIIGCGLHPGQRSRTAIRVLRRPKQPARPPTVLTDRGPILAPTASRRALGSVARCRAQACVAFAPCPAIWLFARALIARGSSPGRQVRCWVPRALRFAAGPRIGSALPRAGMRRLRRRARRSGSSRERSSPGASPGRQVRC
jgi:hypothetical protein